MENKLEKMGMVCCVEVVVVEINRRLHVAQDIESIVGDRRPEWQ